MDCGDIQSRAFTQLTLNSTLVGGNASLTCDRGYRFEDMQTEIEMSCVLNRDQTAAYWNPIPDSLPACESSWNCIKIDLE